MSVENRIGEGKYVISVDSSGAITQLQQFEKQAQRTGENTKRSFQQGLTSAVGLASGIASLGFQYDNLDKAQLRVQRSNLEVSRAMEQVRRLEQQGKSGTLDYAQAKERLAIANEKLRQAENDATQGNIAFGLSIVQTITTIPNAIKGIQGLTSATKLLDMATSKWTLIAIAAIAAFEGIAHVIKMINPEIDITIEGMGTRLIGAFNKARGGAEDLTGSIGDLSDEQRKNQDSSRFFEGNLFNMTTYYDEQNKKLTDNIKLLKEKRTAERELLEIEKKSSVTNKGTLWDNIIKSLTGPLIPSAHAQIYAGDLLSKAPKGNNSAVEWARGIFLLTKRPSELLTEPFPEKPFNLSDLYAPALSLARKPKSDQLKAIEQEIKDELKRLQDDQELIRRQREVSGLLALKQVQNLRERALIDFVGQEIYDRILVRELQSGATIEQAKMRASEEIKHTSRGQITVLPSGGFIIKKSTKPTVGGDAKFQTNLAETYYKNSVYGGSVGTPIHILLAAAEADSIENERRRMQKNPFGYETSGGRASRTISNLLSNIPKALIGPLGTDRSVILNNAQRLNAQFSSLQAELAEYGLSMPGYGTGVRGGKGNVEMMVSDQVYRQRYADTLAELSRRKQARIDAENSRVMSLVSRSGLSRSQVVALETTQQGTDDLYGIIDYRERLARASTGTG